MRSPFPKAASRQRRRLVASALALACLAAPAVVHAAPAHAATSFTLFDDTTYNDANLVANYGLTPAAVVYDSWDTSCADTSAYSCTLPSEADFQAKVEQLAESVPATDPVSLDLEGIDFTSGTPAEEAANEFEAWKTLLGWARAVIPSTQPLGTYGYDWEWNSTETGYESTLHEDYGLSYFSPSLYTYADPDTAWSTRLSESVANDEAADANQPTYPFVWPQWDISGQPNTFMDAATWSSELSQLQSSTAGAIVWSGVNDLVTSQSNSCAWIGATRQFMSTLTGDDESGGNLGVTAAYPSTCLLTRGSAASVPLTVTNNGSSTSSATTLSVTTASGITASPASDAVPALAAGGTWSTTVTLTPSASASLGDTVVGYAFSGEGAQYTTAIVEDPDLASGKTASQSSTTGSYTASLAVDGGTDPALADGSVAETTDSASPWWQVDLGSSQSIGSVAVWSSTASTVENYFLVVSSSATPTVPSAPTVPNQWVETSSGTYVMYVTRSSFRYAQYGADTGLRAPTTPTVVPANGDGVSGRYVRVQMLGTGTLSLAEVQVRPGAPDGTQIATTDAVANGGFAADSTAGWTNYGSATSLVTSPAVAGGPYTLDEGDAASSEQTISVLPNTTYTLAGFGAVSASGNQVEIGVKDYGGSQLAAAFTSTTWSLGSVTFTTGASTTSAVVFCYHDVGSGSGYCANITASRGGNADPADY